MTLRIVRILAFLAAGCLAGSASAQTVLTVQEEGASGATEFTLDDLKSMDQTTVITENEFIDGEKTFRGPLVRDVLFRTLGDKADLVTMTAANDYQVEISIQEFFDYDAILALTMDGVPLSRRNKGPIWLIYPMSDHAELRDPVYNARLIWQLVKMEFR
ncbi:MAG: molybdopterin-dependent oxidoreductase [Paracoccaceae bacterium]